MAGGGKRHWTESAANVSAPVALGVTALFAWLSDTEARRFFQASTLPVLEIADARDVSEVEANVLVITVKNFGSAVALNTCVALSLGGDRFENCNADAEPFGNQFGPDSDRLVSQ